MKLFGFDIFVTRHARMFSNSNQVKRPLFDIMQGWTPNDWVIDFGPYYVVVSRLNRAVR